VNLSIPQILVIARREFLATVRRKAFLFTVLGTPAYFAFIFTISMGAEMQEHKSSIEKLTSLGVVDSSGLLGRAEREMRTDLVFDENPLARSSQVQSFHTTVTFFPDQSSGEVALRAERISQLLVVPADYLKNGRLRRYARSSGLFSSLDRRAITTWLVQGMVAGQLDSSLTARIARPTERSDLFTLSRDGTFELKDDRREMVDFMLPMAFGLLLGLAITVGGQYLLQGVSEEKESRILEALLCTTRPEELLAGKLLGLGGAGLLLVALWASFALPVAVAAATIVPFRLPPGLAVCAIVYFLLGYLFYASLMIGIGGMTNNMREAQQFAVWFSFANFAPFVMLVSILGNPNGPLATALSLFPPTAATAMMLRLASPSGNVPAWQLALSIALLAGAAVLAVIASARIFRIGMLLYGKAPTLPEILRWARRG
jgi:ABC-2 type transport system permease protein